MKTTASAIEACSMMADSTSEVKKHTSACSLPDLVAVFGEFHIAVSYLYKIGIKLHCDLRGMSCHISLLKDRHPCKNLLVRLS
jgi:hypothetical protein